MIATESAITMEMFDLGKVVQESIAEPLMLLEEESGVDLSSRCGKETTLTSPLVLVRMFHPNNWRLEPLGDFLQIEQGRFGGSSRRLLINKDED